MSNPPQILIEPIVTEKDISEFNENPEDTKSLTVPFSKFLIDVGSDEDGNVNDNGENNKCLNLNLYQNHVSSTDDSVCFGQSVIGKILISSVNRNTSGNDQQIVWVQIYHKSSSLSSKLNSQNVDIPSFVVLLKSKTDPQNSEYIPDYCSPPYLRLNLRHILSREVDERRFQIHTRCGEGITLHAEIADEHSVHFWLSIFNQNALCTNHFEPLRSKEMKPHSAPNSPRRTRRGINSAVNSSSYATDENKSNLNTKVGNSISRVCVFETLSEAQEIENEV
ncbi:unnamed protein product [Heterobilharzia americana]|nr:unnamed protein product [Heterobilharzia americana]CAH8476141.1 unnamed protein product [Heterobilharzia americana]